MKLRVEKAYRIIICEKRDKESLLNLLPPPKMRERERGREMRDREKEREREGER